MSIPASMLSSGALVIHSGRRVKARPVGSPLAGQPNERTETSVWVSTLLGPEEAAASWGFPRTACRRGPPDGGSRHMVPSVS
jgi:hypothetical protein